MQDVSHSRFFKCCSNFQFMIVIKLLPPPYTKKVAEVQRHGGCEISKIRTPLKLLNFSRDPPCTHHENNTKFNK